MNETLARVPDGRRSIKQLYLNDLRLFQYDKGIRKYEERRRRRLGINVWCRVSVNNLKQLGEGLQHSRQKHWCRDSDGNSYANV